MLLASIFARFSLLLGDLQMEHHDFSVVLPFEDFLEALALKSHQRLDLEHIIFIRCCLSIAAVTRAVDIS